eukprot:9232303-Pyramimonas_sp.AAC.2
MGPRTTIGNMMRSTPAATVVARSRLTRVGGSKPARTMVAGAVLASSVISQLSCRCRFRW